MILYIAYPTETKRDSQRIRPTILFTSAEVIFRLNNFDFFKSFSPINISVHFWITLKICTDLYLLYNSRD